MHANCMLGGDLYELVQLQVESKGIQQKVTRLCMYVRIVPWCDCNGFDWGGASL